MSPELEDYIERHISPESPLLSKIDRETNLYHINGRMCSGHIQGRVLKMLVDMIKPDKVLELGTFTGYSALCIAEALKPEAMLHTIECDDELEEEILSNLNKSPHGHKVTLHIGDALKVMEMWEPGTFDLVLIDADKRQYPEYLEKSLSLVRPGGYILADNTLWGGHVTETTPHASQTSGVLEFNDMVMRISDVEVAILPFRDGLTIIKKKEN